MIKETENFIVQLTGLLTTVRNNNSTFISRKSLRDGLSIASKKWLQNLSPHLRATSSMSDDLLNELDSKFEKLLGLASTGNRKTTYVNLINPAIRQIQQSVLVPLIKSTPTSSLLDGVAAKVLSHTQSAPQKDYLDEAFRAARTGCFKAAIVMTWCAAIDRLQSFVLTRGLRAFSQTSTKLKQIDAGFYKRFTKEFTLTMENELHEVFDKDLIIVISGMGALDLNQVKALFNLFDKRNSSAHPSANTEDEFAYASFLNELNNLVFNNKKLV